MVYFQDKDRVIGMGDTRRLAFVYIMCISESDNKVHWGIFIALQELAKGELQQVQISQEFFPTTVLCKC